MMRFQGTSSKSGEAQQQLVAHVSSSERRAAHIELRIAHEAEARFQQHLRSVGMKTSRQRLLVLRVFLATRKPVSRSELHYAVKREDLATSFSTTWRTLKAIVACGMARE